MAFLERDENIHRTDEENGEYNQREGVNNPRGQCIDQRFLNRLEERFYKGRAEEFRRKVDDIPPETSRAEIYRRLSQYEGRPSTHASAKYPKHEGDTRDS
jgi:hypothetical protein